MSAIAAARSSAVLMMIVVAGAQSSPEDRALAPRVWAPPRDVSEYYPPASLRLGETGRVILRFTVNADGHAVEPVSVNEDQPSGASPRLVVAAERYLGDLRFDTGERYKKVLVASFVFELAPCGALEHSLVHDYSFNLCRDRPPPVDFQQP